MHRAGVFGSGSLSALTTAEQPGGQVSALVVGGSEHVQGVMEKVGTNSHHSRSTNHDFALGCEE